MDKMQLLELEKNAHLSINELRNSQSSLTKPIEERLEQRSRNIILKQFANKSDKLHKIIQGIKFPINITENTTLRESTLKNLRIVIEKDPQLAGDVNLKKEMEELSKETRTVRVPGAQFNITVKDLLKLEQPIAFNPEFFSDLNAARLYRLSDATELGDNVAKILIDKVGSISDITQDKLDIFVQQRILKEEEAKAVGLAASLYNILDERIDLVNTVKSKIKGIRELITIDKATWVKFIRDSKTNPPGNITVEEYSELISKKMEHLFFTETFAYRLAQNKLTETLKANVDLDVLRKLNPNTDLLRTSFDKLKTSGFPIATIKILKESHSDLLRFVNRYAGMQLAIILDGSLSDSEKEREVVRRVSLANQFFANNPDIFTADLTQNSAKIKTLNFGTQTESDKLMLLAMARSYQRALAITDDLRDTEFLVAGGFRSALSLAATPLDIVISRTGLEKDIAKLYQEKAKSMTVSIAAHTGNIIDNLKEDNNNTRFWNLSTAVPSYLKEIPGFADFFGNQDFCNCKHCQSILSPAAYFVDMMSFIEENITRPVFASKPDHPLNLSTRRPDLWNLELTCENTNKPIPYLVIINEILENAIAKEAGFNGDFQNRQQVKQKVYKEVLANQMDSFKQPFHLALAEVEIYLKHFERSLSDVVEIGHLSTETRTRLILGLSTREHEIITTKNVDLIFLQRIYNMSLIESAGVIQKFDAQTLLKPMGITRDELEQLIATQFITKEGTIKIHIKSAKRKPNSIQNDIENIQGLTREALDRMHRFVRMWRAIGGNIGELDLVLSHLKKEGFGFELNSISVIVLARIYRLRINQNLNIEELIALWSTLPGQATIKPDNLPSVTSPLDRLTIPLIDRLFNDSRFVEADGIFPKPNTLFLHPALATRGSVNNVDPNLYRLRAGIGTNDEELCQLIGGLSRPLGIVLNSNNNQQKQFALTLRNLSLLYRHARLTKLLNVRVPELFSLIALLPGINTTHIETVSDLEALFKLHTWWKKTKWTLNELVDIVTTGLSAIATSIEWNNNGLSENNTITYVATVHGVPLPSETITLSANVTLSDAILYWNEKAAQTEAYRSDSLGVEKRDGNRLSIRTKVPKDYNSKITISADSKLLFTTNTPQDFIGRAIVLQISNQAPINPMEIATSIVKEMDNTTYSKDILLNSLSSNLNISSKILLCHFSMLNIVLNDENILQELQGDTPTNKIANLISRLLKLAKLFSNKTIFTVETLEFIKTNKALFGITDFEWLNMHNIQYIELFSVLLLPHVIAQEMPNLKDVLLSFDSSNRFKNANQSVQKVLAALLQCDASLIVSLHNQLTLSKTPFEVLQELLKAVDFAQHLGVDGSVIQSLQSGNYDEINNASIAIQAAFHSKYKDDEEWQKTIEPFQDKILSMQRDGLVAYMIHSSKLPFDQPKDLYYYFLLDVELEGCARTSRVASAIDTIQLYVNRCLMNLEETAVGDSNPIHVLPSSIPENEWSWRKNYRVWEANRKIFLYPENFIEPELRDNKTPLFKTLEEELLSKEITNEAVLEAYARYLRGFDELAHLRIAGSYHEKDEVAKRDTLHLLGVTSNDPPVFYYRRVEEAHYGVASDEQATHWGAWEKLNIQVPVRTVSPIIYKGQLYVFWIRYVTKSQNDVKEGNSYFVGYQHRAYVEFSKRNLDGSWSTPQKLKLNEKPFAPESYPGSYQDDGVVLDPIVPKGSTESVPFFFMQLFSNFQPLYDNKAHEVPREDYTLKEFQWDRLYLTAGNELSLRGVNFQMWSPVDLYRLKISSQYAWEDPSINGVPWLDPSIVALIVLLAGGRVGDVIDALPSRLIWSRKTGDRCDIYFTPGGIPCFDLYTYASLFIDERFKEYTKQLATIGPASWMNPQWSETVTGYLASILKENKIGDITKDATIDVVNGSVGDVIIQTKKEVFYLQTDVRDDNKYHLRRLSTSLSQDIADILFNQGLEDLLATKTQLEKLKEHPNDLDFAPSEVYDDTKVGAVDFQGPMGTYLREIFFHIPFLIANHLNSQGKYEEAQRWYNYIFDPTANDSIVNLPQNLTEEERRRRELDRCWRYREFRGLTLESFRDQLSDRESIEEYKRDPFNPHAIARLRVTAYQKSIVMKYIDNLLDWGDELFVRAFAQLNPEYLREATLKYVTAQDILGDRPVILGACGEGQLQPKNYLKIKEELQGDSEFLIEMESKILSRHRITSYNVFENKSLVVNAQRGILASRKFYRNSESVLGTSSIDNIPTSSTIQKLIASAPETVRKNASRLTAADITMAKNNIHFKPVTAQSLQDGFLSFPKNLISTWGLSFIRQVSPIFCVPQNEFMLDYWDRVKDRLYKLRNCLDINGVFRELPLFAPPIDLGLLVSGKALGINLQDILNSNANPPPYRFQYLIDKAKGFVSVVQNFGAQLLSALEKRDAEELVRLRDVHQKNILMLTTEVKKNELKIAEENLEMINRRQMAAQYRKDYYEALIANGLNGSESLQVASQWAIIGVKGAQMALATAAGTTYLLPQVGSPFAMKYGGQDVGNSLKGFSLAVGLSGQIAECTSMRSGLAAGFERREEEWKHQLKIAEHDLKSIDKELTVAQLRLAIENRSLELHEKAKDQQDEIMEFFAGKFSNLGLYTHLSRSLQQLYREAYNNALMMAKLVEIAYHFERPSDNSIFVSGGWDASRSGLLAGEQLLMALHNMEKRFIETNTRQNEINQSFSLAQIEPQKLIQLKETGACEFAIPEFYFDLFYPGQYRRRIRAVRLSVPCVTGPYTNVGAKLTLLKNYIRNTAELGASKLIEKSLSGTISVATSSATGDGGVFELNYRDERYMPFEGAGAVSQWQLELPKYFRPFDYHSISDVILSISYTADETAEFRQEVEKQNSETEGTLLHFLHHNNLMKVFSLRHEFSNEFNRLLQVSIGNPVSIEITERHFPLFLQGCNLAAVEANMVLVVKEGKSSVGTVSLSVNNVPINNFEKKDDFGGLPARTLGSALDGDLKRQHSIMFNDLGNLTVARESLSFDPEKLKDILIVVKFGLKQDSPQRIASIAEDELTVIG